MNSKLLALFAHYIATEVAYGENRAMCTDMVCEVAKKTGKRFDEKAFREDVQVKYESCQINMAHNRTALINSLI